MSIGRVSTASNYSAVLANLMQAESRQVDAQNQVSTGKIGDDLKGFGDRARTLVATQSVKARVDGLVGQLNGASVKLSAQQLALQTVSDSADGLKQTIMAALANDSAAGMMTQVGSYFSQTTDALNTRYGDGYLFSGGQVGTAPVTVSSLSQLSAAPSTASVFANGTQVAATRIDDSTTVQTGFLADAVGAPSMDIMRNIQQFDEGPSGGFSGQLTDAQRTFLEGQLGALNAASSASIDVVAQGGDIQKAVETAQKTQTARQTSLKGMLGDITDVDVAQAATNLSQAQAAVQASAQVFVSLKGMSLLNYLSPGA